MGFWSALSTAVIFITALVAPLPTTNAHGFLAEPASRNFIAHKKGIEDDHFSLSGGGPDVVWHNGYWKFGGGGHHYTCGRKQYNIPGKLQAIWKPGQTVNLVVTITTAHRGHIYFGLCSAKVSPTPKCFAKHWLKNAKTNKQYWDLAGKPEGTYKMKFILPKNFECPKCVLWMWWVTGNSCHPPGDSGDMRKCGQYGAVPEEFWNCADVSITKKHRKFI